MVWCCRLQVGLFALKPLANGTGGALWLYNSIEESAMPQVRPEQLVD